MMRITTCLLTVLSCVAASVPSESEQSEIVRILAQVRGGVEPPASNMNAVKYSVEMQNLAVDWVSRCLHQYPKGSKDPKFQGTGMILKPFYDKKPQFKDLFSFANESNNYNYDTNRCSRVCRNYKLMVRASVTEVGCSMKKCPYKRTKQRDRYYLICVFNNADNNMRGRPYQRRYERREYPGKSTYSYDAHSISAEIPKYFTTKSDTTFLDNEVPVENSNGLMEITDALQAAESEAFVDDTLTDNSSDCNPNSAYSTTKLPSVPLSTPSQVESHHEQSNPSASSSTSSSKITSPHFVAVNLLSKRSTSLGSITLGFGVLQFLSIFFKLLV